LKILRSLSELAGHPSVVTIGNFDGVHCGHREVIATVCARARELGVQAAAVTFDPHPAHVLHDGPRLKLITPLAEKLELLATTGLDLVLVLPFDEELRHWSAEHFATAVLRDGLRALEVHEGETFRFGHHARADVTDLARLGESLGFTVQACRPVMARGAAISSSRIRRLIAAGSLGEARSLMGRVFSVRSTPASGRGYGTLYTVPTINLAPYADLLPANGVYVTTLSVAGRVFKGVTNAGNRPTFGADSFAVETHLLDFEPIALSEETPLELAFLHRLREERRFESVEALRAQIGVDVRLAERFLGLCGVVGVGRVRAFCD